MIAYIRGTLAEKSPGAAIVEAAGVGYQLEIPLSTFDRLPRTGEEVKLFASHIVREDDETLYGFATVAEREMFLRLTAVSGVGPKIALAILSGASLSELSLAIASSDARRLSAIKGVGKKTAEKICIELKDKVSALEALAQSGAAAKGKAAAQNRLFLRDAILALATLGFPEETAAKMAAGVLAAKPDVADTQTVVRLALASSR